MNVAVAQTERTNGTAMNAAQVRSANGAASYQPGATPQEQCPPQNSGLKARAIPRADGSGFQPSWIYKTVTQGVALGWYETGALPLWNKPAAALTPASAEVLGNINQALSLSNGVLL